jgi:hypothetical protein
MCADVPKHRHEVRTEVKHKPQRQYLQLSYSFYCISWSVRDMFIFSKTINTIFNYITDNLKNMDYEKTSQSKQWTTSVKYKHHKITLVANVTLAWWVSAIAFTLCLTFPAIQGMEFKLLSNDPDLNTGCAGTSPTCYI